MNWHQLVSYGNDELHVFIISLLPTRTFVLPSAICISVHIVTQTYTHTKCHAVILTFLKSNHWLSKESVMLERKHI